VITQKISKNGRRIVYTIDARDAVDIFSKMADTIGLWIAYIPPTHSSIEHLEAAQKQLKSAAKHLTTEDSR